MQSTVHVAALPASAPDSELCRRATALVAELSPRLFLLQRTSRVRPATLLGVDTCCLNGSRSGELLRSISRLL